MVKYPPLVDVLPPFCHSDCLSTCVLLFLPFQLPAMEKGSENVATEVCKYSHTVSAGKCYIQSRCSEDRCAGGTVMRRAAAPTLRMGCNFIPFPWMKSGLFWGRWGGGVGGCLQNNKPWCNKSVAHYQTSQQTNCIHQPLRTEKPHFSSPQTTESETRHSPIERKTAAAGPPSALASNINPISRKHAGFGPRYANVRPAAASHPFKRTPDGDIFTSALPPKQGERSPLLLMWRITYTGSVGARGPPVTASFLSQILTKKDAVGCASPSVNFRDTCRSPGYFCAPRCLLFSPPLSPTNSSLPSWMEDHGVCITQR